MARFRWGIFGTGEISAKFVAGLAAARDAEASFVASRSLAKAQRFAASMGIPRAIEGYSEAAAAGGVDAIYIATPPSEHAAHALLSIGAGIPVLVEKPFASNPAEAQRIAHASRARSVFAMEAMWTRFLPAVLALKTKLAEGSIGEVRMVTGNFGSSQSPNPAAGNFDPARGGGAVADLGVYPLSLAQGLFGTPTVAQAIGSIGGTGVDEDAAFQLRYPGGEIASFFVSLRAWGPNDFYVLGTEGLIGFHGPIARPHGLTLWRGAPLTLGQPDLGWRLRVRQHGLVHLLAQLAGQSGRGRGKRFTYRYSGNGFNYEADEVRACVERGTGESAVMPLDDSIAVISTVEIIRNAIKASGTTREVSP